VCVVMETIPTLRRLVRQHRTVTTTFLLHAHSNILLLSVANIFYNLFDCSGRVVLNFMEVFMTKNEKIKYAQKCISAEWNCTGDSFTRSENLFYETDKTFFEIITF